jgi:ubiquinone/menaquinone biosynthesis C-methylase UbiE
VLARARRKLPVPGCTIDLRVGDAQALALKAGVFDVAILNLILSVVPDPVRCVSEALRVVRPRGRVVVFDKFLQDGRRPSLGRRLLNFFSTAFGTDINQRLVDMIARQPCSVVSDEPSLLGGMYRVVPLQRPPDIETREQGRRDR